MNEQLKGQLRHALTAAAAYAVGKGWLSETAAGEIISFAILILPFVWSWLAKKSAAPAPAPTAPTQDTPGNPS